jgi:hypothetical protein
MIDGSSSAFTTKGLEKSKVPGLILKELVARLSQRSTTSSSHASSSASRTSLSAAASDDINVSHIISLFERGTTHILLLHKFDTTNTFFIKLVEELASIKEATVKVIVTSTSLTSPPLNMVHHSEKYININISSNNKNKNSI